VTRAQFVDWLETWGRAWRTNDPAEIGALVPEKFTWHTPFVEIVRDRQTLVDRWVSTGDSESDVETDYEILALDEEKGISRYSATYLKNKTARVRAEYILMVSLDEDGRCTEFHEWGSASSAPLDEHL
jgi:hypothetical protein